MNRKRAAEIMGVHPKASPAEVKRAYHKKARILHPDRNADPKANAQFQELSAAFDEMKSAKMEMETVQLEPTLQELLGQRIFLYTHFGQKLSIPLWHHDLVFDNLRVVFVPKAIVDENNNLFWSVEKRLADIVGLQDLLLEELNLSIPVKELRITKEQTYVFKGRGIPKVNLLNMFDVSRLADVIVFVKLNF
jgi:hypothetical protein